MDPLVDLRKHHEELLKVSKEALEKDRRRKDAFEGLIRHPGWREYQMLLATMIQARADEILAPAGSAEKAMLLEFVKGSMNGLILARDLPSLIVESTPAAQLEDDAA